ncbi:MAG: sigma-70 family RNA polymerase sigma factor [Bacteroidales bacterium]|nr:sigma-70 family RNA polymerase sigma factor [Bacteroidales bacterium]
MEPDYTQLVEGCRRGDPHAQRALYDALSPMALGVCMRYARDRHTAQDLLQDGFIKVFENIGRLKKPESVGAWVYKVMVNRCVNHCKRHRSPLPLDEVADTPVSLPLDPFALEEVVGALQQLPPQQRTVFNLVEVEDYSYSEVAARLQCSEHTVRANLSRAKSRLKEILNRNK